MRPIFLGGPLAQADLLARLSGGAGMQVQAASLPGHAVLDRHGLPVLADIGEGACSGVLVDDPPPGLLDALARYDAASGQAMTDMDVGLQDRGVTARVSRISAPPGEGKPWHGDPALLREMLDEILRPDLAPRDIGRSRAGLLRRAIGRMNARHAPAPQTLGTKVAGPALRGMTLTRHHGGFFVTEGLRFSHRLIGGGWSGEVDREVFVTGDAVSVLPWDPATGQLLLIRQLRAGMVARQDPDPWNVEAIAGLVDRDEDGPQTARREAEEEAGLTLGRIAPLAEYYTSPGTMTEYIRGYVALCDLADYRPGIHGLDAENEDIETLLVTEAQAADALDRGEVRNAPLMISLLAFFRKRGELIAAWGLPLAGGQGRT